LKFSSSLELSTLTPEFLDYVYRSVSDRAGEAAIAREGGLPVFGLMLDVLDFERMMKGDAETREDLRYAKPQGLITGYDMGFKVFRGFGLMHDARQMRFRFHKIGAGSNSTDDQSGQFICTRVRPLKAGRAVTIGNVPEPDPKYYRAEVAVAVVFMNDVFSNLFVPSLDNLGSGLTFGPQPGLTGQWQWINIRDNATNQLGESGYFYGRLQIFPKPLLFSAETTAILYRRCPQAWREVCEIQGRDDVGTGAIAVAANAVEADFDSTYRQVDLTLASKLDAGVGDAVTVTHGGGACSMTVASDALAPTYTFAWASGASNAPTVYTNFTTASTVEVV
jgi:hypothetical protein